MYMCIYIYIYFLWYHFILWVAGGQVFRDNHLWWPCPVLVLHYMVLYFILQQICFVLYFPMADLATLVMCSWCVRLDCMTATCPVGFAPSSHPVRLALLDSCSLQPLGDLIGLINTLYCSVSYLLLSCGYSYIPIEVLVQFQAYQFLLIRSWLWLVLGSFPPG